MNSPLFYFARIIIACGAAALTGCALSPQELASKEAHEGDARRRALQEQTSPITPQVQAARDRLLEEYRQLIASLYPSYNGIQVEFQPNVYGPEWGFLVASHPLFSGYEFSVGPTAPTINQWIAANTAAFAEAHVNLVRIRSSAGVSSMETGAKPPL